MSVDIDHDAEMVMKILIAAKCDGKRRGLDEEQLVGLMNLIRAERMAVADSILKICGGGLEKKSITKTMADECRKAVKDELSDSAGGEL